MKRVIGIGIIGLGGRGLGFARQYNRKAHAGFELKAVCDLNPELCRRAGVAFGQGVTTYTDMHKMLARPEVEAVIIATNDPHHVEPALAALEAGKHVLCEKPLCQTIADAQRICVRARTARGIFLMGFELRQAAIFRTMRRLLDEGRIGTVKIGHAFDNVSVGGNYFFHDPDRQKAFYKSLLLQKASHSLDLLNWFMGSTPVKVYGIGGLDFYGRRESPDLCCSQCTKASNCPYRIKKHRLTMDYDAEIEIKDYCVWNRNLDLNDNSELCITYANGGKATFQECHFTPEYSREYWLVGDQGKLYGYYDNPGRFLVRVEHAHANERYTEEFKPEHTGGAHGGGDDNLREEFYRRIVAHEPAPDMLESAYYSTALAICAEDSIATGQPVAIPSLSAV